MVSDEELLIVLMRQVTFERNQKAGAIDKTTDLYRVVDRNRLFGHLGLVVFQIRCWFGKNGTELQNSIELFCLQCLVSAKNVHPCSKCCGKFLHSFVKFRKANINIIMTVSHWTDFRET
jgi:hypothetical protein